MTRTIDYLHPEFLQPAFLDQFIYPSTQDLYWSESFDPSYYKSLARAGFISVCIQEAGEYLLLPEIQSAYAVLDWENIRLGRHVRRLLRDGTLVRQAVQLSMVKDPEAVLQGIATCHGSQNWLYPPYQELMTQLAAENDPDFSLLGVELRSHDTGELIGGELGYAMGGVWTSLSGFLRRDHPSWNHFGTVQLLALAQLLRQCGFAFWNLGHPHMDYKMNLGAKVINRIDFISRWRYGLSRKPQIFLGDLVGKSFSGHELLQMLHRTDS